MAGKNYDSDMDFKNTLVSENQALNEPVDIYFIGFQETRKLNAFAILKGANKTRTSKNFNFIILDKLKLETQIALNKIARKYDETIEYLCFAEVSMWGHLILGFCKSSIKWKISKIATTKIKQGLGGKTGNKGAVVVRFNLDNTSFIIANAHLESGKKNLSERLLQFKEIVTDCKIGKKNRQYNFQSHKVKILFGDLNFRINLDYEECKVLAESFRADDKHILNRKDQLNKAKLSEPILENIWEGPLDFRPTYKYNLLSDYYDTSKKQRAPAWWDRILWFENEKHIDQLNYERKENQFSDHRPVLSFMSIMTYDHDNKLMRELKQQMVKQKKDDHFKTQRESYFNYALTGRLDNSKAPLDKEDIVTMEKGIEGDHLRKQIANVPQSSITENIKFGIK